MSVVVPFPMARNVPTYVAAGSRGRNGLSGRAAHTIRGGTIMSWVRAEPCTCCGRPTLHGRDLADGEILCSHCTPPNAA